VRMRGAQGPKPEYWPEPRPDRIEMEKAQETAAAGTADPRTTEQLVEVAKQLNRAVCLCGFYPKGHSAIESAVRSVGDALAGVLSHRDEVTIGSTGEALLFEGVPFGEERKPARDLARHLKVRDLSGITFKRGVSPDELREAVERLSLPPDDPDSTGRPEHEKPSQHVVFHRLHYERVIAHVSGDESSDPDDAAQLWTSLIMDDLYGDPSTLDDRALSMITESIRDKSSFKRMTAALIEASKRRGPDSTAFVTKGLKKTCEGLSRTAGETRARAITFLAEELQGLAPDIVLGVLEESGKEDTSDAQAVLAEAARCLPTNAKLALLAHAVRAKKARGSKFSSVFRHLAGAELKRRDLLSAARENAEDDGVFRELVGAVRDLVVSDAETKYVGSSYASMLEEFGHSTGDAEEDLEQERRHLSELRASIEARQQQVCKAQFLLDLARNQETRKATETLAELNTACSEMARSGDVDAIAALAPRIAECLAGLREEDRGKEHGLKSCLRSILVGEAAP